MTASKAQGQRPRRWSRFHCFLDTSICLFACCLGPLGANTHQQIHTDQVTAAVTVPCFLDQPLLCLTVCKSAFWWQLPVLSCSPINTDREGTFNRQGGRHCWLSAVSLRMTPCLAVINNRLCVSTHRHGPWSRPLSLLWCSWQLRHGYPRRRSPVSRATLQGGSVGDVTYEPAVKAILSPPPPLSLFQCIEMLTHWVLGLYCLVGSDRGF